MSSEEVAVATILSGMFSDTNTILQQSAHASTSANAAAAVGDKATGAGADRPHTVATEKRKTVSDASSHATTEEPNNPATARKDASKKMSKVSKGPAEAPAKAEAEAEAKGEAVATAAAHKAQTESDPAIGKKLKKPPKDGKQVSPASLVRVREVVDMSSTTTATAAAAAAAHDATSKAEASKFYHCSVLFV
jgi:hypothetical protein